MPKKNEAPASFETALPAKLFTPDLVVPHLQGVNRDQADVVRSGQTFAKTHIVIVFEGRSRFDQECDARHGESISLLMYNGGLNC